MIATELFIEAGHSEQQVFGIWSYIIEGIVTAEEIGIANDAGLSPSEIIMLSLRDHIVVPNHIP